MHNVFGIGIISSINRSPSLKGHIFFIMVFVGRLWMIYIIHSRKFRKSDCSHQFYFHMKKKLGETFLKKVEKLEIDIIKRTQQIFFKKVVKKLFYLSQHGMSCLKKNKFW